MPSDGKPEHELPYTQEGRKAFLANKPTFGVTQVEAAITNDPMPACNPQGFPRIVLHNFRTSRIVQTPENVLVLYEFNKKWRVIWTDGRALPKDPEPRWLGYSIGKWEDDHTFVTQTNGVDGRTWLDKSGRPHSEEMRVEERFHRISKDMLELTVTIDDPTMYTAQWKPLDKFRMKLLPEDREPIEMLCSVSEYMLYNERMKFGNPTAGTGGQRPQSK